MRAALLGFTAHQQERRQQVVSLAPLDGDGKSDFTVWRERSGVWYAQFAAGGSAAVGWGTAGDKPSGRVPES